MFPPVLLSSCNVLWTYKLSTIIPKWYLKNSTIFFSITCVNISQMCLEMFKGIPHSLRLGGCWDCDNINRTYILAVNHTSLYLWIYSFCLNKEFKIQFRRATSPVHDVLEQSFNKLKHRTVQFKFKQSYTSILNIRVDMNAVGFVSLAWIVPSYTYLHE